MLSRGKPLKRTGFAKVPDLAPKPAPGPRMRKCKVCREPFLPRNMTHVACKPECAAAHAEAVRVKQKAKQQRQERAETKAKLLELKPRKYWVALAKKAMHLFVRTRDEGQPCCSCDTVLVNTGKLGGDYDAGHMRSVGSAKHLEFDPRNVWGQCKDCNMRLHGNEREYARRLRIKMGNEYVDGILQDNAPRHLKTQDFQALIEHYKQELKKLQEK